MKLTLPTSITLPRKKKKDRKIIINKNVERNLHWIVYSQLKQAFTEQVKLTIPEGFKLTPPCHFHYVYYHNSKHKPDLDNCLGIIKKFLQDSLVELGYLKDDNVEYIVSNSEAFGGYLPKAGYCEVTITTVS